ncbi:hypothetical protein Scep_002213 [Stephania cephalantha]|uniref:Rhamnogalacturonan lyase domain-containing protein n=1 Tax=Stephania cephalantha TaxID=152367 RepID=A0AAP0L9I6_9MAGN
MPSSPTSLGRGATATTPHSPPYPPTTSTTAPTTPSTMHSDRRGSVYGRLLVHDRFVHKESKLSNSAYIGLARPGVAGSWQTEGKGYQFWTRTNADGVFSINNDLVYTVGASDYTKDWFYAQVTRKNKDNTFMNSG